VSVALIAAMLPRFAVDEGVRLNAEDHRKPATKEMARGRWAKRMLTGRPGVFQGRQRCTEDARVKN
jgi:hypothetical protein